MNNDITKTLDWLYSCVNPVNKSESGEVTLEPQLVEHMKKSLLKVMEAYTKATKTAEASKPVNPNTARKSYPTFIFTYKSEVIAALDACNIQSEFKDKSVIFRTKAIFKEALTHLLKQIGEVKYITRNAEGVEIEFIPNHDITLDKGPNNQIYVLKDIPTVCEEY